MQKTGGGLVGDVLTESGAETENNWFAEIASSNPDTVCIMYSNISTCWRRRGLKGCRAVI